MNQHPTILLVEDDSDWLDIYLEILVGENYKIDTARSTNQAFELLQLTNYDAVITDLKMLGFADDYSGFSILQKTKEISPGTQVVVITAYGSRDVALKATQQGAFDYVVKPPDSERFKISINRAIQATQLILSKRGGRNNRVTNMLPIENPKVATTNRDIIIGNSIVMQNVFEKMQSAMDNSIPLLIWGEPGTGKQLIAKSIHNSSSRKTKPFSRVDCHDLIKHISAIQRNLDRIGGGTLFLDDLSCIDEAGQTIVEELITFSHKNDIRIIASFNTKQKEVVKALLEKLANNKLPTLFSANEIYLPPLRERKEDIPALIGHFINSTTDFPAIAEKIQISPEALALLLEANYSTENLRQISKTINSAIQFLGGGGEILQEHIIIQVDEDEASVTQAKVTQEPLKMYISYCQKDKAMLERLETHLSSIKNEGIITSWNRRMVTPGSLWEKETAAYLNAAEIIILLISADYLASYFTYEKEVRQAISRQQAEEVVVIPVLVKPCSWQNTLFGDLKPVPFNEIPVSNWRNREDAWVNVVDGIRSLAQYLLDLKFKKINKN